MGPIKAAIQIGGAYAIGEKAAQAFGEHGERVLQHEQTAASGTNTQQHLPQGVGGYAQHINRCNGQCGGKCMQPQPTQQAFGHR